MRQLPDPADAGTNFMHAVIRNPIDGTTLATVRLTDEGNQRFYKKWQVPADVSGLGFFIDITTEVFTDSDYTVPSTVYGKDNNDYLVFDRITRQGGGGMSVIVDYKKIGTTIRDFFSPYAKERDRKGNIIALWPDTPQMDFAPILASIQAVQAVCESIKMPELEKTDFEPVYKAIADSESRIAGHVANKEVTKETDLTPVLDAISRAEGTMTSTKEEIIDQMKSPIEELTALKDNFDKMFKADYPDLAAQLDKMVQKLQEGFAYATAVVPEKQKRDRPKPLPMKL